MKFRDLTKNDIDVRVATANEKGASLLLYKDARVDMDILGSANTTTARETFSAG